MVRVGKVLMAATFMHFLGYPSWSANYYVAPMGADISCVSDGSLECPWGSVAEALDSNTVMGGDTLLLRDGRYGQLSVINKNYSTPVTIRSENKKNAHVTNILVGENSRNITFENLSVWPIDPHSPPQNLLNTNASSSYIIFAYLDVRAGEDAQDFLSWSLEEWEARLTNGAQISGSFSTVRNSTFTGMGYGIMTDGSDARVLENTINGYSRDGMRGLADRGIFQGNRVTNCVKTNANHDDGFQSWARNSANGGSLSGLVIEENFFIEWTENQNHPLKCKLQGIGLFDGFYDNLIIRNNVVSVSMPHGISVYGARGAQIVNNTVVTNDGNPSKYPWIGVYWHKQGFPPTDVLSANNVAMSFAGEAVAARNVVFSDNSVVYYPAQVFEDVQAFDYYPKLDSGFIDTGDQRYAPSADILKAPRPYGAGADRGAYEFGAKPQENVNNSEEASVTSDPVIAPSDSISADKEVGKWIKAPSRDQNKEAPSNAKGKKWVNIIENNF